MIDIIATQTVLYQVNLAAAVAIPIVFLVSSALSFMIQDFIIGKLKYIIFILFLLPSMVTLYVVYLDASPYNYIVSGTILIGGLVGFSPWIKDLISEIKR